MIEESEIKKFISRFIGISEDKLPRNEEQLIDSIASEGVRLSLFQSVENRNTLKPIHIMQVKNWAIRKTRSFLDYFNVNAVSKISEVIECEGKQNMVFLKDIVKLSHGYIIPSLTKYVKINSSHSLLISGFPTFSFVDIGLPVFVNGISRSIIPGTIEESQSQYIFELDINDYLEKNNFENEPEEFLEFLVANSESENWVYSQYDYGYLGYNKSGEFMFGKNPIKVALGDRILTFWRTTFENNHTYRLKLETRSSRELSIPIPNTFYKRVCLAMDSISNIRRSAILSINQEEAKFTMDFSPPAAEMRLIYALGGIWKKEGNKSFSFTFSSSFLDEVKGILNGLWIEIERG